MPNTDPVSLHRFLNAQADVYSVALAEFWAPAWSSALARFSSTQI